MTKQSETTPAGDTQISFGTVKSWKTGILNEHNMPILMLETNEGVTLNVVLPPQGAIDIGKALQQDGEKTAASAPIPN